ncbi:acyl-CoA thioesterase [Haliea sp. E17]|uniref:acyl-CoA thioesterase n=1 Tax=Haliea sp. E17 TaxID=3401576 RepID=UPI003AAE9DA8
MTASPHPFDQAIRLQSTADGRCSGQSHPAYANLVGPFGGVTAATLLNAAMGHPDVLGEPVALTVNYAAPIADEPFDIRARAVRTNRSTQHWIVEMQQDGDAVATATAVFARRRETWSALEIAPPPVPPASEVPVFAIPPYLPRWLQNYEMRLVHGDVDFSSAQETDDSVTTLWMRDHPPRPLDHLSLAALSDAFLPRIFVRRQRFVPIGTVTLTTYFHADSALLAAQGEAPLLATARASRFRDGYFDQTAELWGSDGELLATTHQLVYYRE